MSLLDSEIFRIKYELGYNALQVGAEPYISFVAIFDIVIKPFLEAGAITSSSTAVAASALGPASVALVLASASGVSAGQRLVVDVDSLQEVATVQSLSGSTVSLVLSLPHSGTYPVAVEGGESMVREVLANIRSVKQKMASTYGTGLLRQVDEIGFFAAGSRTAFGALGEQLSFWREELASLLGVRSAWSSRRSAGARMAVY